MVRLVRVAQRFVFVRARVKIEAPRWDWSTVQSHRWIVQRLLFVHAGCPVSTRMTNLPGVYSNERARLLTHTSWYHDHCNDCETKKPGLQNPAVLLHPGVAGVRGYILTNILRTPPSPSSLWTTR